MNQLITNYDSVKIYPLDRKYIYFAAVCTLITACTTVIIHFISFPSGNFEETVLMHNNSSYLLFKWIILFHCLMVLFSMLGVSLIIFQYSKAMAILGFLFFNLFVFAEWQRTLNDLWYINGLRMKYTNAIDENLKTWLRYEIQHNNYQSNVQFLLFTIGITFGNAINALALLFKKGKDRFLGIGLMIWALFTSCAFIYDFIPVAWMEPVIHFSNHYYQPAIRVAIAVWLFHKAMQLSKPVENSSKAEEN